MTRSILLLLAAGLLLSGPASARAGTTWFVDDDAAGDPGPGDPLVSDPRENGSIDHPFDAIQEAIDAAADGDVVTVAAGTYTGAGNRDVDYGGRLITVRGATGDPADCVVDAEDDGRGFIVRSGETAAARLEAITVANGFPDEGGGGALRIVDASPTIVDCVFESSQPMFGRDGGGVLVEGGAPVFVGCAIRANAANFDGRGGGAAVVDATVAFTDCTFFGNISVDVEGSRGGGLYLVGGSVTMTGCTVSGNSAFIGCCSEGGGVYNEGGTLVVDRCLFRNNGAGSGRCAGTDCAEGGAIRGVVTATNTTFIGNSVSGSEQDGLWARGGAIRGSGTLVGCVFIRNRASHATFGGEGGALWGSFEITNCTFVENVVEGPGAHGSVLDGGGVITSTIVWSNAAPAIAGPTTISSSLIDVDPLFVTDPAPGPDGTWGTSDDEGDLDLQPGSPAIDAGDNTALPPELTTDVEGRPRFVEDAGTVDSGVRDCARPLVDIGATEFQATSPPPADVDGDGVVWADDVAAVVAAFGPCDGCPADIDGNGAVDVDDVIAAILDWGCVGATCRVDVDCNGNGVPDAIDLLFCVDDDLDGNGMPDGCDPPLTPIVLEFPFVGPITFALVHEISVAHFARALSPVAVTVRALADLDAASEFITLSVDGVLLENLFVAVPVTCPGVLGTEVVDPISPDDFNAMSADDVRFVFSPSRAVGTAGCPASFLRLEIAYLTDDCNGNGVHDAIDVARGTSADLDGSGFPDECEVLLADCNGNGVPDAIELNGNDCNGNGVPDDCEPDCDASGVPDDCETFADCDRNGVPDPCQPDCDGDGVPDACDSFDDCDGNGNPDPCDPDCDGDGIPDACDTFDDCDRNGVPDACDPDCDGDGVPDACDPAVLDCNGNGVEDVCELTGNDCDGNGVLDTCEIKGNDCNGNRVPDPCDLDGNDCNGNDVPDECDVASGRSTDDNGNGVLDECEAPPNDDCGSAATIQPGVFEFDTTMATTDGPGEFGGCFAVGPQVERDVWFRWFALEAGTATVSLCGSSFDTRLVIYGGACPNGPGLSIACNDDACGAQSEVTFDVTPFTLYRIRVGGAVGASGPGTLLLEIDAAP